MWPSTRIQFDGPRPDAKMLAGLSAPDSARRPDLVIAVGQIEIHVEAKRLSTAGPLPRLYVMEGMMRFVRGNYAWASGDRGLMLSYNLSEAPAATAGAVNAVIHSSAELGPSHELRHDLLVHDRLVRYLSDHGLPYVLKHLAVDMR